MNRNRILVGAALALAALGGCGGSAQTGKISVLLKDAPAAFSAAVVTITEVDLVGSGGTTVLSTTKTTTDLLKLANDTALLVDGAVVPVGTYSQLRFVITGGYVEVGGVLYASSPTYEGLPEGAVVGGTLRMPSFAESGLKIDLPAGAATVGTAAKVVLVDFDVSQSFGQDAGASGAWVMHPVVQATELQLTGDVATTLALAPGVTLPAGKTLADFEAVLTPGAGGDGTTVPLAADASGVYGVTFKYLLPGAYTLTFSGPSGVTFATSPAVPATVTVSSGQVTAAPFLVTSVAAAP
ncbi:DUF4382 domain-containing protein [Anaeromyxobacter oryzae]|uniref:DUF4382 domain-containing protein n=1 Tax=Anaeromyxobacter oryzae TaxID=2918170 RepID=A0ABM7WPM2_9BACT|nr:DUF4382 domain-containing protein [Anaeromyxobacter oryzae]BDG01407.1 hypothetical protein AMOR_04030 [Anaeromyxobacter oryzae]